MMLYCCHCPLLQNVFQHDCCGSDGCGLGGVPTTCSAQCADAFLPYFSSCGKVVYSEDHERYTAMESLMHKCAAATHSDRTDVPIPDDPCRSHTVCSDCRGNCGWCREELSAVQLISHAGGYCASTCVTTADECGRAGGINR